MKVVVIQTLHNMTDEQVKQFTADMIVDGMPKDEAMKFIRGELVSNMSKAPQGNIEIQSSWQILADDIPRMTPEKKLILTEVPLGTKED